MPHIEKFTSQENGFVVDNQKRASICRKQGCRTHGERVIYVYPPLGRWINLPFKVEIWRDTVIHRTQKLRIVSNTGMKLSNNGALLARTPAVWEAEV